VKFLLFAAAAALIYWLVKGMIPRSAAMGVDEAARLLGVSADADGPTIIDAHRKLIAKVHPDAGGTAALAANVNRARDVMLARLSQPSA
jgi:DnaJ family protein C protein 19